jgi:hypothetical protein
MRALIQLAILAVVFVAVYAALRDAIPKECIAVLFVAGLVAFGWIRQQIEL